MKNEIMLGIAERYGTPVYIYDLQNIREQIKKLKESIGIYPKTKFLYAVKANYNIHLVKEIINQGFGIDAVSPEEVQLGINCGVDPKKIMFTGNNITDSEMIQVHEMGVLLNIDSLSRLEKFGKKYPGSDVCVRFNPNIGGGNHKHNITGGSDTKFGISYLHMNEVLKIVNKYNLRLKGIHEHIGSGWLELDTPLIALNIILEIASKIPGLDFVNIGGGFGIPYHPNQKELDIKNLGKKINEKLIEFYKNYGIKLELRLEPGRYIVCKAGYLLTKVNTIKKNPEGKIFVGTDTGMNQMIRVALYDAYHSIVNLSNKTDKIGYYNICGNVCESSDFFAKDRKMSEIREGDILSIENTGAYGFAMSSNYQFRPLPAEVIVDGNKIILSRRRETFDDLLNRYKN